MSTPPTPKPSLLRRISSDLGISLQVLEVLIGVISVIVAIVIPIAIYQLSKPNPNPTPSSTSPIPVPPTTTTSAPTPSPTSTDSPSPSPTQPTPTPNPVRRSTDDKALTLSAGYSTDLDSMPPGWGVKSEENEYKDIEVHQSDLVSENGDMAIVSGAPKYETCQDATAYQVEVEWRYVRPGLKVCVRTSENRYAFVTVEKFNVDSQQIQLDVVVWDPPFE
jgi:hypothetical protein